MICHCYIAACFLLLFLMPCAAPRRHAMLLLMLDDAVTALSLRAMRGVVSLVSIRCCRCCYDADERCY